MLWETVIMAAAGLSLGMSLDTLRRARRDRNVALAGLADSLELATDCHKALVDAGMPHRLPCVVCNQFEGQKRALERLR